MSSAQQNWIPPEQNELKVNIDASVGPSSTCAAAVGRDVAGRVL